MENKLQCLILKDESGSEPMEDLLILGAGGHGKVVLDCAINTHRFNEIYFLDDNKVGEEVLGHLVLDKISAYRRLKDKYTYAVVAIGNNAYRLQLINELLELGYKVPYLIHPSAIVSEYSKIGEGTVVLAGAILNPGCEVGKGTIINTEAIVEHDCIIADGVHLSPAAKMGGEVIIGEKSWVCIGATIINQITIGAESIIAAGAVVTKNVNEHTSVFGIPAKEKESQPAGKILILANHDVGLYKFRKELIQALLQRGHKVYISLPKGEWIDTLQQMGCQFIDTSVDRRGINPFNDVKLLLKYNQLAKQINPQQIITYTIKPNIYGGLISRWRNIPYLVNITGLGTAFQKEGFLKKIIVALYKMALKKAKYVLFENQGNKQTFIDEKIITEEKGVVMNGAGVNLEEYPFTPLSQGEKLRFLFIGRVMKEKGIDELFAAARRIKDEYNQVEFDIVGPLEDDYETVIKELEQENIIHYYGYQKDVKPFISQCHCFVLPSYHEGMANTLLEAAAMGRPLITSDIHGCKETVKENGYLVKVKDTEDLYQKIQEFIRLTPSERASMGEQSRKYIEEQFDKKKIVEKTLTYIER